MRTSTNLLWLGGLNQSRVLDAVRRSDGISRVELAEQTGLTAQTVSNIVRRLLEDGLVLEDGRANSRGGKPATVLRLNAGAYYAVGMHIDPASTTLVVTDLAGRVVARSRRRTPASQGPQRVIDALSRSVRAIVAESSVSDRILGLGVATPGPLDTEGGAVTPPHLPGWRSVPLREALAEGTGLKVVIDNDATAATIGERWSGGEERSSDMAFVYVGTGVGGGLVLDGRVYRGATLNAAEIGHVTVDPSGPACPCGNRGCLETYVAPHAVASDAARLRGEGPADFERGQARTVAAYRRVCREAHAGDAVALEVVSAAGRRLGQAATTLLNLVDVPLVVLGGWGMSHVGDLYGAALLEAVSGRSIARSMRRVRVETSRIGEDVGAIGAAALVLHSAYAPEFTSV
ncbi:ROK family transcriptional regulator [Nocardiopsis prasina]|uniref:ROK family transcriptional regulator n=1 Tax=Nocardiopsis prasina TaxID=2015 RepID=UPI00034DF2B8|nr:ROK family transcriptional regulator [Nocardiopsis prasina]